MYYSSCFSKISIHFCMVNVLAHYFVCINIIEFESRRLDKLLFFPSLICLAHWHATEVSAA